MCIYGIFGLILAKKNIEMNKRPPLTTLLSAMGCYWNKYSISKWWHWANIYIKIAMYSLFFLFF